MFQLLPLLYDKLTSVGRSAPGIRVA